jgi:hypothetical protein
MGLVAARPDLVLPAGQAADLPAKFGVEVTHELRKLASAVDVEQKVVVVRSKRIGVHPDSIEALGAAQALEKNSSNRDD